MQCSPLLYGTGSTGYPNLGQFHYCNPPLPQHTIYPEIIGEGEVASVVFPDGNIHLYFIPLNKRFPSTYQQNFSYNPYFNNSMGAYYVKSISNPISFAMFNQQCQQMYGGRLPRPSYISDCNVNIPSPGFQLKFHNDCWTSTTDLHYFFPRIRRCEWFPLTEAKENASIQVDTPVKETRLCNQEVTCARPCICSMSDDNDNESCSGNEVVESYRDNRNSQRNRSCIKDKQKCAKKRLNIRNNKQKLNIKTSNNEVCECNGPITTDKSITTYAEQASSAAENERNTQTSHSCTAVTLLRGAISVDNKSDDKTELWLPKISQDKQALQSKSLEKITDVYESTCSSATCCCSTTDTETRDA